jgi:hypothetical protein
VARSGGTQTAAPAQAMPIMLLQRNQPPVQQDLVRATGLPFTETCG